MPGWLRDRIDRLNGLPTRAQRAARDAERATARTEAAARILRGAPLRPGIGLGKMRFGMRRAEMDAVPGFELSWDADDPGSVILFEPNGAETVGEMAKGRLVLLHTSGTPWIETPDGPFLLWGQTETVVPALGRIGLPVSSTAARRRESEGLTIHGGVLAYWDHMTHVHDVAWWDPGLGPHPDLPF